MSWNWTCPQCERHVTITEERQSSGEHFLRIPNSSGDRALVSIFVVCPNVECKKFSLTVSLTLVARDHVGNRSTDKTLQTWTLVPEPGGRTFPDFVPQQIREDYAEACRIRDLSPKASATLSRRALQGIIRDFWKVKPGRLFDEIAAIEDKVDETTWAAIDAVRKIGNIGAHMEKDVNVIIDVEPQEAALLIHLIETVITEWYVRREERNKKMKALIDLAAAKG